MNKHTAKRLLAAMLSAAMVFALAACGGGESGGEADSGDAGTAAMTEDEYVEAFNELSTAVSDVQAKASQVDVTNEEDAKDLLESLKAPFSDFMSVTPPESYAAGHEKMQSGCQAMIDYIDAMIGMIGETDTAKMTDALSKADESMRTAVNDMVAAAQLLDAAAS